MKAKIVYLTMALVLVTGLAVAAVPSASVSAFTSINIYVDDDFPDTQEYHDLHMWTTIQEGINDARDGVEGVGDTVTVLEGTYPGNIDVNKDYLTLWGESASKVTVIGNGLDHTIKITALDVKVRQLKVTGATGVDKAGVFWADVDKGYLEKCDITGNYNGIMLQFINNQTIKCNNIHNNTGDGIEVRNSQLKDLTLNTIYSNYDGISLYNSSQITIWYNKSYSNSRYGIYVDSLSHDNDIYLNDFYGNTGGNGHSDRVAADNNWETPDWTKPGKEQWRYYCYDDDTYEGFRGNNWGDYGGSDLLPPPDGDGIGDSPYSLGTYEQDTYPLISSYTTTYRMGTCPGQEVPECTPEVAPPSPPNGNGCFIATAAYGTSTAAEIDTLRAFRDEVLLESTLGSQLVEWYYQTSPPVADFISQNEPLRTLFRELLVDPVTWLVEATEAIWGD